MNARPLSLLFGLLLITGCQRTTASSERTASQGALPDAQSAPVSSAQQNPSGPFALIEIFTSEG